MMFENKGIFEWDIIIEKGINNRIGICAPENLNYEASAEVNLSDGY